MTVLKETNCIILLYLEKYILLLSSSVFKLFRKWSKIIIIKNAY